MARTETIEIAVKIRPEIMPMRLSDTTRAETAEAPCSASPEQDTAPIFPDHVPATSRPIPTLKFGRRTLPLTQAELDILEARLADHLELTCTSYGFIASLLAVGADV